MLATAKRHLPYLGIALALYAMLTIATAYVNDWYKQPFSVTSDLNIHIAWAHKIADPRLYARDPALSSLNWRRLARLDYLPFPLLLNALFPIAGGIRPTLCMLSLILGLAFSVGMYATTVYLYQDSLAGVVVAFLASLDYQALGGVQLGFGPGNVLPRNFVLSISPAILLLSVHWRQSRAIWAVYGVLGLAANFHSLSAMHLALILTLGLLLANTRRPRVVLRIIAGGIVFLVGALPFVITFLPEALNTVMVTPEESLVEVSRYSFALRPSLGALVAFGASYVPFVLFGLLGLDLLWRGSMDRHSIWRTYVSLCLVVLLLPWLGVAVNSFTLSLRQLELLRISRYYFVLALAPVGAWVANLMQRGTLRGKTLAVASLVSLMVLSRTQVAFAIAARALGLPTRAREAPVADGVASQDLHIVWDWESFTQLAEWADSSVPIDALFLTPVDWAPFWVYARRGIVVTWKAPACPEWSERYANVVRLYDNPEPERFVSVARSYDADYVVVMTALYLPGLDRLYENEHYAVYRVAEATGP